MAAIELAILDISLPNGNGTEAAVRLHREPPRVGIIMLTPRSGAENNLVGLYDGADQYLVNPCALRNWRASSMPCYGVWRRAGGWNG